MIKRMPQLNADGILLHFYFPAAFGNPIPFPARVRKRYGSCPKHSSIISLTICAVISG